MVLPPKPPRGEGPPRPPRAMPPRRGSGAGAAAAGASPKAKALRSPAGSPERTARGMLRRCGAHAAVVAAIASRACCAACALLPALLCGAWLLAGDERRVWARRQLTTRFNHQRENPALHAAAAAVWPGVRRTRARARRYYDGQRPRFLRLARDFRLHEYWARTADFVTSPAQMWPDMLGARAHAMARSLRREGREDYRCEKDRIDMYAFFFRSGLPTQSITHVWGSEAAALKGLRGLDPGAVAHWPIFLKASHLTQGSMEGHLCIKSPADLKARRNHLLQWVREKSKMHSDDYQRLWRVDANALTDTLAVRYLLQQPYREGRGHLSHNSYRDKNQKWVAELKTEVLWGRAYLATDIEERVTFLRDNTSEVYWYGDYGNEVLRSKMAPAALPSRGGFDQTWLAGGHLRCVWRLAELAAALLGIEEFRVDIFVTDADPDGCAINEDSISSGHNSRFHAPFMARLWAEGLRRRQFQTYDNGVPAHMQTRATAHEDNLRLWREQWGELPPMPDIPAWLREEDAHPRGDRTLPPASRRRARGRNGKNGGGGKAENGKG